ncbi:DUF1045 domain-containing protein, partial [Candidatus Dojkabacteria bacterium]|nr:DUF1045 domain-containing protein [Candidatus Dojkabacteria bacterium]
NFDCHFVLDSKNFFPHITLYSPEFPIHNIANLKSEVVDIASTVNRLKLKLNPIATKQDGYIGLRIENTTEIHSLHKKVVDKLNPFREGILRNKYSDRTRLVNFTSEQLSNIHSYGYPDVMKLYDPHITITKLIHNEDSEQVDNLVKPNLIISSAEKLGIFEMGEHGTCIRKLEEIVIG